MIVNCVAVRALEWAMVLQALPGLACGPERADGPLGRFDRTIVDVSGPEAVAAGPDGEVVICETGAHLISVFDQAGRLLRSWGECGQAPGQLDSPAGVAVDGAGRIVVADTGNHRVQVFDRDGSFLSEWSGYGRDAGRLINPTGVAVHGGLIYIADTGNHRVQVFGADGASVRIIGQRGRENGQFMSPTAVAVGPDGRLYVADTYNHRVQVFDADGRFLGAWGEYGPFPGLLAYPTGLAWDGELLLVVDSRNHRIQAFNERGEAVHEWGSHALWLRDGEGRFETPTGIAVTADGAFAIVTEPLEDRCQVFGRLGDQTLELPPPVREQSHFGQRLMADGDLLVLPEPDLHAIGAYNITGEVPILIGKFGVLGAGFGQLLHAPAVCADATTSDVFVSDVALGRVQKFRLKRDDREQLKYIANISRFVKSFNLAAIGPITPTAITRDRAGRMYVLDAESCRLHVLDEDLAVVAAWGEYGHEPGRFRGPTDVAIDEARQRVYIVDRGNRRVQAFDPAGAFQFAFVPAPAAEGIDGAGDCWGIAVGPDGALFITDPTAHRIGVFGPDGTYVESWGGQGEDEGRLFKPRGITCGPDGRIYVSDFGNHRVQVFDPSGRSSAMLGWRKPRKLPGDADE